MLRGEQGADLTEKAPGTEGGEAGLSVYECREGKENPTQRPQTSCTKPAAHPGFWRVFFFFLVRLRISKSVDIAQKMFVSLETST